MIKYFIVAISCIMTFSFAQAQQMRAAEEGDFLSDSSKELCVENLIVDELAQALENIERSLEFIKEKASRDYLQAKVEFLNDLVENEARIKRLEFTGNFVASSGYWNFTIGDYNDGLFDGYIKVETDHEWEGGDWRPWTWSNVYYCRRIPKNDARTDEILFHVAFGKIESYSNFDMDALTVTGTSSGRKN